MDGKVKISEGNELLHSKDAHRLAYRSSDRNRSPNGTGTSSDHFGVTSSGGFCFSTFFVCFAFVV